MMKKLVLLAAVCALSGCSSTGRYNLHFELSPECRDKNGIYPSMSVDVFGVSEYENLRAQSFSVNDYFQPGNSLRKRDDLHTTLFTDEKPPQQIFSDEDELWQKWENRGVNSVCVVANIPGVWFDKSGMADTRRLIIPIEKDYWSWFQDDIYIKIFPGGMNLESPIKSETDL